MDATIRVLRVTCLVLLATVTSGGTARAQDDDACINASEQALAERNAGKLIEARASLARCAASSCPDLVRTSCQQRVEEINRVLPSIVFVPKDGSGRDMVSVKITIDGTVQAERLDGGAIVVDPGEHEFRLEVAGHEAVVKRLVLYAGEQNRREAIVFGGLGGTASSAPRALMVNGPDAGTMRKNGAQRMIGIIVGGVGVAGLAVGGIFGVLALSGRSSYEKNCGSNIGAPAGFCNAQGVSGRSDAATKGNLSTISFGAGAVVAAAGAVVWLTARSGTSSAQVGVGPGILVATGRF